MNQDLAQYIPYETYYREHVQKAVVKGTRLTGLCPFHEDKSASISVDLTTGQWHCFGCGRKGNVITFEAMITKTGNKQAMKQLAERFHIPRDPSQAKPATRSRTGTITDAGKNPSISPPPTPTPAKPFPDHLPTLPDKRRQFAREVRGWSDEVISRFEIGWLDQHERYTIPVRDDREELVNIRMYRPGSTGAKVISWCEGLGEGRLYPLSSLSRARDTDRTIWLCEGEPDTLCALSHGLTALTSTTGASAWKDTFSHHFGGLKVVIAYDNDQAGREGARKVASQLAYFARSVEIISWPDWMTDKQDLTDFFMTHKRTISDLEGLFRERVAPDPALSVMLSRKIEIAQGCYWHHGVTKDGAPTREKLSNFRVEILKNICYPDPQGVVRSVRLIGQDGSVSRECELDSATMANRQPWAAWCLGRGNFNWTGTFRQLEALWQTLLDLDDGRMILRHDHIGWIPAERLWLFPNLAVQDGRALFPDDEGVVWTGARGHQPLSFDANRGKQVKDAAPGVLPQLNTEISKRASDRLRQQMVLDLKENLGGFEAYLALGYVAACCYQEEIFRHHKFPILFLYGRRQCGKNTLASIIMSHWGMDENSARNINSTRPVALARYLEYFSAVPVWMDEYRNEDKVHDKDSILRSAYDHIGDAKGWLGYGVIMTTVRSPLILSGEQFPQDSALASRCAMLQLSQSRRQESVFSRIQALRPKLSGIVLYILLSKTPERAAELVHAITEAKERFRSAGLDVRLASLYAVLSESFAKIYNPENFGDDLLEFEYWLSARAQEFRSEKEDTFLLSELFSDLEIMRTDEVFSKRLTNSLEFKKNVRGETSICVMWLKNIYHLWEEYVRRRGGRLAWKYMELLRFLKEEPYFIKEDREYLFGSRRRCVTLDLNLMPEPMRDTFG